MNVIEGQSLGNVIKLIVRNVVATEVVARAAPFETTSPMPMSFWKATSSWKARLMESR